MVKTPPSTPPSPSSPVQATNTHTNTNNNLSDIFSDSPPSTPTHLGIPSDIPRLRSTHATAGYRTGITTAKTRSLQPGFDEGYSLGAVIGLRVGYILGALEGLWCAYHIESGEKDRFETLLKKGREELKVEKVFGKEYWDKDGIWTYEVTSEGDEATFREVAEQHPVMKIWYEKVREEMGRAGIKLGRFEGSEWEAGRVGDDAGVVDR
jgi:hypothetical protein